MRANSGLLRNERTSLSQGCEKHLQFLMGVTERVWKNKQKPEAMKDLVRHVKEFDFISRAMESQRKNLRREV